MKNGFEFEILEHFSTTKTNVNVMFHLRERTLNSETESTAFKAAVVQTDSDPQ